MLNAMADNFSASETNINRAVAAHSGQKSSLFRAAPSARNFNLNGLLSTGMTTGRCSAEGDCIMKAKKLPDLDVIKSMLKYNPETGVFIWRISTKGHIKKGVIAGTINPDGYYVLSINCERYSAHRVAWKYYYGIEPCGEIDHINRDRADCRICNLRDVTSVQNARNKSMQSNNTSGHTGVYWNKSKKKWMAAIRLNGTQTHLGYFERIDDAIIVRSNAESERHVR